MIQANELRIGNQVEFQNSISKIYAISKKGAKIGSGNEIEFKYINPIPLTPEILEKCGFEKESAGWFDKNSLFNFIEFRLRDNVYSLYHADKKIKETIEYLHQLQNLYFALTGEEIEVKESVTLSNG